MAQVERVAICKAEYSENLLPTIENRTITINSGIGDGVANYNSSIFFDSGKSIKMDITSSGLNKFINFSLSGYETTISRDGNYLFSYRLKKVNTLDIIDFAVEIFVNGILTTTDTNYDNNLKDIDTLNWCTFAQNIALNAGDVLSFRFVMNTDLLITSLFLDGLKLELDDRNLGIPSVYSLPLGVVRTGELQQFGVYNFQHSGATVSVPSGMVWTDIPNNGLGVLTTTAGGYDDVVIYDPLTGLINFSDLNLYDFILARFQAINVNTSVNNQVIEVRILLSVGSGNFSLPFFYQEYDTSGDQSSVFGDAPIHVLTELTKNYPAKFQIRSSASATLTLDGFNFMVQKRIL